MGVNNPIIAVVPAIFNVFVFLQSNSDPGNFRDPWWNFSKSCGIGVITLNPIRTQGREQEQGSGKEDGKPVFFFDGKENDLPFK